MPESPPAFADSFLNDEELDIEALAARLPAAEYDTEDFCDALGVPLGTFKRLLRQGLVPPAHRQEKVTGSTYRSIWSAQQVAWTLRERDEYPEEMSAGA